MCVCRFGYGMFVIEGADDMLCRLQLDPQVFIDASQILSAESGKLTPQGITSILWSFYQLAADMPAPLAEMLAYRMADTLNDFIPQGLLHPRPLHGAWPPNAGGALVA